MKTLHADVRRLAQQAHLLVAESANLAQNAESLTRQVHHVPADALLSNPEFLELNKLRTAAVRNLKRVRQTVAKLTDDDSILQSLGPLLDDYLQTLLASGQPVKEAIRAIEDKDIRKIITARFRQLRTQLLVEAISSGAVQWHAAPQAGPLGLGIDERIVEFPLAFEAAQFERPGRILDAGAAMNLPYLRRLIGTPAATVVHFTQSGAKEVCSFEDDRYSYVFGDLRDTYFRDGTFDRILCISTLEHIGMDNSRYGGAQEASAAGRRSDDSHIAAVTEMLRILSPGGRLALTVPYGEARFKGWYQIFDEDGVSQIRAACQGCEVVEKFFHYDRGWVEGKATQAEASSQVSPEVDGVWAALITKPAT